jgi:putative hydrolase of the HAD superfamily
VSLFFDLDDTLYPRTAGVVPRVDRRINRFLEERVGIAAGEVDETRRRYWREHGTTLRGLMLHHAVDPDEYLAFVHDVDLDDVLAPDAALAALLEALPGRKAVFTNGSRRHAERVLARLGVSAAFVAVYALEDLGYVPKPFPTAYETVLRLAAVEAATATMLDDNPLNLPPAKAIGMRTIGVGEGPFPDGADVVVATIHEIRPLFL